MGGLSRDWGGGRGLGGRDARRGLPGAGERVLRKLDLSRQGGEPAPPSLLTGTRPDILGGGLRPRSTQRPHPPLATQAHPDRRIRATGFVPPRGPGKGGNGRGVVRGRAPPRGSRTPRIFVAEDKPYRHEDGLPGGRRNITSQS